MTLKYKKEELKALLTDFYVLTKIRIVIFDEKFNEILAYPEEPCPFCSVIKANAEGKAECDKSDKHGCMTCHLSGELYVYKCHAGLIEACVPIKINNIIFGYIMFGQITDNSVKGAATQEILKYCERYQLDEEPLLAAISRLKYKNAAHIKAAAKIMESCATHLWISELVTVAQENLAYRIEQYIQSHIAGDLSVDALCEVLLVSRSKLYETVQASQGVGVAEYIRKSRLKYAATLLANGYTVREASEQCGIGDYNYFSKMFKKFFGVLPSKYAGEKHIVV